MTLSDLERRGMRGQNFLEISIITLEWFDLRMTEYGTVTQMGEKHISRGQPGPYH